MPTNYRRDRNDKKLYVILHNIRSAFNVGSIFRTAEALGLSKLFLGGYTPRPDRHSGIGKTALGAEQYVPWESHWRTDLLLNRFSSEEVQIVALELSAKSEPLHRFSPRFPMALLLGSEVHGLRPPMLKRADRIVEIPMRGKKESLNVSVAFGIAAYALLNG